MFSRLSYFDKNLFIRRVIFACLIVLFFLIQSSAWNDGIFGIRIFWLIPLSVSIAMFERETSGMLFALLAGALWDASSVYYGFNAVFLTVIGFVCGTLISNLMRNNLSTALLMTFVSSFLYSFIYWLISYVFAGTGGTARALFSVYLPSSLLTVLVVPVTYFIVLAIVKKFRAK